MQDIERYAQFLIFNIIIIWIYVDWSRLEFGRSNFGGTLILIFESCVHANLDTDTNSNADIDTMSTCTYTYINDLAGPLRCRKLNMNTFF